MVIEALRFLWLILSRNFLGFEEINQTNIILLLWLLRVGVKRIKRIAHSKTASSFKQFMSMSLKGEQRERLRGSFIMGKI